MCVLGLEVQCLSYVYSAKKSFSNWPSYRGPKQPWNSRLTFRGVVDLLPIPDKCSNSEQNQSWVAARGEWISQKISILLSNCQEDGSREGRDLSKVTQQHWDLILWKEEPNNARSFPFCPHHERLGKLGAIWLGGQAAKGTWLWNVLGKQDAFSSRPDKPTGLRVARKDSGYLPSASVSFGLSTPAAKCPKGVRLDKVGKVRGWRWQDIRDQSWRDVPEPLLLHFLSRGWESQSDPAISFPGCRGRDPQFVWVAGSSPSQDGRR